ncbi:hypothetical protein APHNP_0509 [Anaplasma phagocytophilum str. ApNP]|uniref:Uncharacterized protein n=1 Tax=Anaplasma phagocytophilum str. ApNP TaxID=1359153 RepID=A0A0F3NEF1_ANAPH|nr:hypothetical protein APHNP_0509 [Anaplasma phagocytophilum str. ApNP]
MLDFCSLYWSRFLETYYVKAATDCGDIVAREDAADTAYLPARS